LPNIANNWYAEAKRERRGERKGEGRGTISGKKEKVDPKG
jgi:predicted transposase YdaD